ncbi:MAG TPA: hypothetical protein VFK40_00100 [Nitrososphaeraceae archaeon]|jgi:hypothetical protein|nr:hypothetical protein [Nitrososphaeraceae archaeon]HET8793173.1 hypothetical protein [Nitrososphaeraceae archaeon]
MNRKLAIFIIWLIGFGIGFGVYLLSPTITKWFLTNIYQFLDSSIIGALIAGILGSIISTLTMMIWIKRSN